MVGYHTTMSKRDRLRQPSLRDQRSAALAVPFTGDVADWLIRMEVATPFDAERLEDAERWRNASDREHAEALMSLLSVVDAMQGSLVPKPPLVVRFPYPYRAPAHRGPHT
jgi:hypothetical protein